MFVKWADSRCIVCLRRSELTIEHVIPRALGGTLTIPFLCKSCNEGIGAAEEAAVKADPSIRMAIEQVRSQLPPSLARSLTEHQDYSAQGANGNIAGFFRNGRFVVRARREKDGSISLPTAEGRRRIKEHLERRGSTPSEIAATLRRFDESPEDVSIPIDDKTHLRLSQEIQKVSS